MIVYRTQASTGVGWVHEFFERQADAIKAGRMLAEVCVGQEAVRVDRLDIPNTKAGHVSALNLAGANRVNWPGEEVWRS